MTGATDEITSSGRKITVEFLFCTRHHLWNVYYCSREDLFNIPCKGQSIFKDVLMVLLRLKPAGEMKPSVVLLCFPAETTIFFYIYRSYG
jgi:hypothetical protein